MPHVDRDAIRAFLKLSGAADDISDSAMGYAEAIFRALDEGRCPRYDPRSHNESDRSAFEDTFFPLFRSFVSEATGQPVAGLIQISRATPIPVQPWMNPRAYVRHRDIALANAAAAILDDSIGREFRGAVELAQSEPLERALRAVARERDFALRWGTIDFAAQEQAAGLAIPPGFSLRSICFEKLEARMAITDVPSSVMDDDDWMRALTTLQHLFAYAIVGDRERVVLFGRLATFITSVMPIGWTLDDPTTLLVRIA